MSNEREIAKRGLCFMAIKFNLPMALGFARNISLCGVENPAESGGSMKYCIHCGNQNPPQPCVCGHKGTTDMAPSQEPCAYCGARPTWSVEWRDSSGAIKTYWLCAECDNKELELLEFEDDDDDII